MTTLISTNPAKNYEVIGEVKISTGAEVQSAITKAHLAKKSWKETPVEKRVELLQKLCDECKKRKTDIADLICNENGKVYTEAVYEAEGGIEEFQWFIDNIGKALEDEITHEDNTSIHKIRYEPFGVIAVITPWNFPFANILRGIIPSLLVGNTVVLKVSEETPLMGKFIENLINKLDFPKGVFSEVYGDGKIGSILAHSKVDYIWFTGSTAVGQKLYKVAAEKMIPVLLELGGSSPCIVFEDVDIGEAVQTVYEGRFFNAGEVCDALKRCIVHESIVEDFTKAFVKLLSSKHTGDPLDSTNDMGSLIAERQCKLLQEQINDAVQKGAKVLCGGEKYSNLEGAFFQPTLLSNISKDMKVWSEEVFGPVLPIISFSAEDEAIELANDTIYGLGARVISKDTKRVHRVAEQIDAGTVEINYASSCLSCNPFGGYKMSGIGRELGTLGFRNLCQVKLISESK